jgi:hypothetical protein
MLVTMSKYNFSALGGGFSDFIDYMKQERPHRWTSLALAITIAGVIAWGIWSSLLPPPPRPEVIMVQSWPIDRSDFDVRRDWLNRGLVENEQNRARRFAYGRLAEAIGQDFEGQRATREFDDARETMLQALADLEKAEREGRPLPPLPRSDATEGAPRPRGDDAAAQRALPNAPPPASAANRQ